MTDLKKEFKYESLNEFIMQDKKLTKSVLIVPYFRVKNSGDVFALYTLNQKGIVCDFGTRYSGNTSIEKYVKDSILLNSLGTINCDEKYIKNNSSIAYSLVHSVEYGYSIIDNSCPPIIFVRFEVDEEKDLSNIIIYFKEAFKSRLTGNLESFNSETFNIIWMNPEDSFYLSRGTTFNVEDDNGEKIVCNIIDGGIPALETVTTLYTANRVAGDNPFTTNYSSDYNCCPEVIFYKEMSFTLSVPLLQYFDNELNILV